MHWQTISIVWRKYHLAYMAYMWNGRPCPYWWNGMFTCLNWNAWLVIGKNWAVRKLLLDLVLAQVHWITQHIVVRNISPSYTGPARVTLINWKQTCSKVLWLDYISVKMIHAQAHHLLTTSPFVGAHRVASSCCLSSCDSSLCLYFAVSMHWQMTPRSASPLPPLTEGPEEGHTM